VLVFPYVMYNPPSITICCRLTPDLYTVDE
jgi:hypothetical protein